MNAQTSTFTEAERQAIIANAFAMPKLATQIETSIAKAMRDMPETKRGRGFSARRETVFDVVQAEPGCTPGHIRRVTGLSADFVQNDLQSLRRAGRVVLSGSGYRVPEEPDALIKPKYEPITSRRSRTRAEYLAKALDLLQTRTMTAMQLADHFGVARPTARDWANTLEGQGDVERTYIQRHGCRPIAAWRAVTASGSRIQRDGEASGGKGSRMGQGATVGGAE
jgi:biotin operon repressor